MENFFASHRMILSSCFFLIFLSSALSLSFADYSLPNKYFINCGSTSTTVYHGRNYSSDDAHVSSGDSVKDPTSSSTVELYQSARIFTKSSTYDFHIDQSGTYVVRFHFFPFQALGNLQNARFSIDASVRFSLLPDFAAGNNLNSSFPRVEEFLLTIPLGKFSIKFVPNNSSCFAFVNAMEVFIAPPDFINNSSKHVSVTQIGESGEFDGLLSYPLHVIHRINVGGSNVTPDDDPLLRSWTPDDGFLFSKITAKNSEHYNGEIRYGRPGSTPFEAPESVYSTAKQMNTSGNNSQLNNFNISWRFDVRKGSQCFVRVHFCDIVSQTSNALLMFNLYIYGNFKDRIYPYQDAAQLAAPFFKDYVVDADNSGLMNISIGPRSDSDSSTAFLNGIEIMELIKDMGNKKESNPKRHLFVIIGSSLGGLVIALVLLIALSLCMRKKKWRTPFESINKSSVQTKGDSSYTGAITDRTIPGAPLADLNLGLKITLHEILWATKNFDTKLMIGQGGFGKVYKGILKNGTKVAVKRSEPGHGQGLAEFETEVTILSKIRHQHLVSLIGYCNEKDEMILVYEFMEKGTLRDHLYIKDSKGSSNSTSKLSWDERLKICIGAAKGLHYLHTGSNASIIHRDIKSTNILLDENYVAKVADFGLSRSEQLDDQSHVITGVKGTFGYLDPEYLRSSQLTQKSDVYSFGVVLLEVLCGRPVIDLSLPEEQSSLVDWAMFMKEKCRLEEIVDPLLMGNINLDCLRNFGEMVKKCLHENGSDRPGMIDVLWDLEYCLKLQSSVVLGREDISCSDSGISLDLSVSVVRKLLSNSILIDEDDFGKEKDGSSAVSSQVNASEVFSQLRIDEAR